MGAERSERLRGLVGDFPGRFNSSGHHELWQEHPNAGVQGQALDHSRVFRGKLLFGQKPPHPSSDTHSRTGSKVAAGFVQRQLAPANLGPLTQVIKATLG